jgi:glycosyltransferase involved in cell wall biosynthesis
MAKVTIIQRIVPHYRFPFFPKLADELQHRGIELQVIYGQEQPGGVPKSVELPFVWAKRILNRYIRVPGGDALWQPCLSLLSDSDLVVTEQATSALINYLLQFKRELGGTPVAYWGQGVNVRAKDPNSLPERVKAALIGKVDWWFAYTEHTVGILKKSGFPMNRITVVENAVENDEFRAGIESITGSGLAALRTELGIEGENIGLYCGAFIPPKCIDFLLEVCFALKRRIPDFHCIMIGGGPEQHKAEQAAAEHPWIHYVGPKYAGERAPYFKLSRILLQPGTVGLVSVDSFIAEVPLFTTDLPSHGPEITFVRHNENGYIAPVDLDAYVEAVCTYLASPEQQQRLTEGCRRSAPRYTLDNMAGNFADGIERCLRMVGAKA